MNEEIKEILECLKEEDNYWNKQEHNYAFPDYYSLNREDLHLLLDYITNLQQAIEVKNERIKEEQQEKERYIKFYNELNVWNKELKQENEDNLKCIKNLKEQLESVIKNNQELLEKWHKNNDKIVNLISENERLKENNSDMQEEMARTWQKCDDLQQENERLKEENNNKAMNDYARAIDESWYRELYDDYKSRCEKAIEYIKYNDDSLYTYEPDYDYEENLVDNYEPSNFREDLLNILQNRSEE